MWMGYKIHKAAGSFSQELNCGTCKSLEESNENSVNYF
jgi:hypothetical protein